MDDSPLRKLPAELRNTIYEMASYVPEGVVVNKMAHRSQHVEEESTAAGATMTTSATASQSPHLLALTHVCKEIRTEVLGTFYAINNFRLVLPVFASTKPTQANFFDVRAWLDTLDIKCRTAFTGFELDLGTFATCGFPGCANCVESLDGGVSSLVAILESFGNCKVSSFTVRVELTTNLPLTSMPFQIPLHDLHKAEAMWMVSTMKKKQNLHDIALLFARESSLPREKVERKRLEVEQKAKAEVALLAMSSVMRSMEHNLMDQATSGAHPHSSHVIQCLRREGAKRTSEGVIAHERTLMRTAKAGVVTTL